MEKMLNEFKDEYKCQYSMYLESADRIDVLVARKDCDEQEMEDTRVHWLRKRSVMRELKRVAKILGYTLEDIESWEDEIYKEREKDNI